MAEASSSHVDIKYDIIDISDFDNPWSPVEVDPFCLDFESCIVCGKQIVVEEYLQIPSNNKLEQFLLPSDGLNLLSKVFQISTTIYNQASTNSLDKLVASKTDQENIRIYLYCSTCLTTVSEALNLLHQIEDLQKNVSTLKSSVKKNLISTFKSDRTSCEADRANLESLEEISWRTELEEAKCRIRKSYVQCWMQCKIPLKNISRNPSLNTCKPIASVALDTSLARNAHDMGGEKNRKICLKSESSNLGEDNSIEVGILNKPIKIDLKNTESQNSTYRTRARVKQESNFGVIVKETKNIDKTQTSPLQKSLPSKDLGDCDYFEKDDDESSSCEAECGSLYTPDSPCGDIDNDDCNGSPERTEPEIIEIEDNALNTQEESKQNNVRAKERKKWLTASGLLRITRHLQTNKNYRYQCKECGKRYSILHRYKLHVLCHKNQWNPDDPKFEVKRKPVPEFKHTKPRFQARSRNTKRSKEYSRFREVFRIKQQRQHGILPYICDSCGKGYRRLDKFKVHVEMHKIYDNEANLPASTKETETIPDDNDDTKNSINITNVWSTASGSAKSAQGQDLGSCEDENKDINPRLTVSLQVGPREQTIHQYECNVCGRQYKYARSFEFHKETCRSSDVVLTLPGSSSSEVIAPSLPAAPAKKQEEKDYPYRCSVCNKGYFILDYLNVHEQTYHQNEEDGQEKFACTKCDARFNSQKFLNFHDIKLHRYPFEKVHDQVGQLISFTCGWCSKEFSKVNYMSASGEWDFTCDKESCTKRPSNFISFSWHHGGCCDSRPPALLSPLFTCEFCGKQCKTLANLDSHRRSLHTKEFEFYCERCGMGFSTKSGLRSHMEVHLEFHPFKCDQCGKTFKRKRLLVTHIKMHNNDRKYVCSTCGKRFVSAIILKTHESTHVSVKDSACPICGKLFTKRNLWEHVYSIHEKRRPPRKKKQTGSTRRRTKSAVPPPDYENETVSSMDIPPNYENRTVSSMDIPPDYENGTVSSMGIQKEERKNETVSSMNIQKEQCKNETVFAMNIQKEDHKNETVSSMDTH